MKCLSKTTPRLVRDRCRQLRMALMRVERIFRPLTRVASGVRVMRRPRHSNRGCRFSITSSKQPHPPRELGLQPHDHRESARRLFKRRCMAQHDHSDGMVSCGCAVLKTKLPGRAHAERMKPTVSSNQHDLFNAVLCRPARRFRLHWAPN